MKKARLRYVLLQHDVEKLLCRNTLNHGFTVLVIEGDDGVCSRDKIAESTQDIPRGTERKD
jgi:hypothetical protein